MTAPTSDEAIACACTGAIGLRVMLGRLTGKSPHDEACPRWQPPVAPCVRTVYCAECGGPSDVADVTTEENHDGQWRVTLLDCGHQEATPR